MKENMKKRLAVFLCILFVLPAIMAVLPQTAQEVQAAKTSLQWNQTLSNIEGKVTVEKGAAFYIGDYAVVYENRVRNTASMVKASYSSSRKAIASVNGKGYVKAKETGSTNIKIKYKGKTLICSLTVVDAGSFETKKAYKKLAKAADLVAKNVSSKITVNNGYNLIKTKKNYTEVMDTIDLDITEDGFIAEGTTYHNLFPTEKLAVPKAGRWNTFCQQLDHYADKNSPFATKSSKVLKIASVNAVPDKVTINLVNAPSKEQVLALKINNIHVKKNNSAGDDTVYYSMSFMDKKYNYYTGLACMKKGSRTITVIPQKYIYKKDKYVNIKLKKNKTFILGDFYDWTKGKTFTVR